MSDLQATEMAVGNWIRRCELKIRRLTQKGRNSERFDDETVRRMDTGTMALSSTTCDSIGWGQQLQPRTRVTHSRWQLPWMHALHPALPAPVPVHTHMDCCGSSCSIWKSTIYAWGEVCAAWAGWAMDPVCVINCLACNHKSAAIEKR